MDGWDVAVISSNFMTSSAHRHESATSITPETVHGLISIPSPSSMRLMCSTQCVYSDGLVTPHPPFGVAHTKFGTVNSWRNWDHLTVLKQHSLSILFIHTLRAKNDSTKSRHLDTHSRWNAQSSSSAQ